MLIYEDDPMVAELNKGYLNQMEGFQWIGTISDGLKALDFLTKNQVDLILLDVFMPQMNGMELLKKLDQIAVRLILLRLLAALVVVGRYSEYASLGE